MTASEPESSPGSPPPTESSATPSTDEPLERFTISTGLGFAAMTSGERPESQMIAWY